MHMQKSLGLFGLIMVLAVSACSPSAANIYSSTGVTPGPTKPAATNGAVYPTTAVSATNQATMAVPTTMPSTTQSASAMPTTAPAASLAQPWLASDLLNADIYSADCTAVGSVSGLVVGADSGQVLYIWMSTGDALNLGQKYILVPWAETAFSQGQDTSNCTSSGLVLAANQDALTAAPSFDSAPDMSADGWDQAIQAYWDGILTSALDYNTAGTPALMSSLDAWRVASTYGDNFGPLKDLVLNTGTGQIDFIVWTPGGDLFESTSRLVPVPFSAGTWEADNSQFVLKAQMTADLANNAPGFQSLGDITNPQSNPQWTQDTSSYWSKVS